MGAIASSNNDRLLENQENNKTREFPEYLESKTGSVFRRKRSFDFGSTIFTLPQL